MRYLIPALFVVLAAACGNPTQPAENKPAGNAVTQPEVEGQPGKEAEVTTAVYEFKITGMHWKNCAASVRSTLEGMEGVASAEADWEKRWAKAVMKPGANLDEDKARELIGRDFEVDEITRVAK